MRVDKIMKRSWQVRAAAAVIFVLGFVAGALALNAYRAWSRAETPQTQQDRFKMLSQRLQLSAEQKLSVGEHLAKLLKSRVTYHHSGLSYGARAGVIEPLAKAGQLRVVVATMGLAAGSSGEPFQLPTPVQLVDKVPGIPPSRLDFHEKLKKDLSL